MKKKVLVLVLALVCLTMLTGCFCEHEWAEANCTDPKTCTKCEKTEGEALGHVWLAATCTEPEICEVCGITEGKALGHIWIDATCTDPKTCETCRLTEGEALGHNWQDATTEAPQTCAACGLTEGDRIITDPRFTTAAAAPLLGKWAGTVMLNGEMMQLEDFEGELECVFILDFGNAGDFNIGFEMGNEEAFMNSMVEYAMQSAYNELAAQGINKEAADQAIQEAYGLTMEEYVRSMVGEMDFTELYNSIFSALGGVYYVEGNQLYTGNNWEAPMEATTFSIEGDKLSIVGITDMLGADGSFIRVTE